MLISLNRVNAVMGFVMLELVGKSPLISTSFNTICFDILCPLAGKNTAIEFLLLLSFLYDSDH